MTCAYNLCSPITKRGKILYFSSAYNSSFFFFCIFIALYFWFSNILKTQCACSVIPKTQAPTMIAPSMPIMKRAIMKCLYMRQWRPPLRKLPKQMEVQNKIFSKINQQRLYLLSQFIYLVCFFFYLLHFLF